LYGAKTKNNLMIFSAIVGIVLCFFGYTVFISMLLNVIWSVKIFLANQDALKTLNTPVQGQNTVVHQQYDQNGQPIQVVYAQPMQTMQPVQPVQPMQGQPMPNYGTDSQMVQQPQYQQQQQQ
jgi:hypothetical protein